MFYYLLHHLVLSLLIVVYLKLGTDHLTNNSVVVITDIETGANGLICTTTFRPCCKDGQQGEWYYPDRTMVPGSSANEDFSRSRSNDGEVRLSRRNSALSPTGIFHCELPGPDDVTQTLYVGVYADSDNGELGTHAITSACMK